MARALEIEKEDILANYRDATQQVERLEHTVETISAENKELFGQVQNTQKEVGGASFQIAEYQQKEENYIQEIMTLERHIDHVTRQLEDTSKSNNQLASEREQILEELSTFKGIANNQEANKTELQREISRFENEKISLQQRIQES